MRDWLLFLGAGASVAPPTGLPSFLPLSRGVLRAMGWHPSTADVPSDRRRWLFTGKPSYPDITNFDAAPEVLFGTLNLFGVPFAPEVARVLSKGDPNAVHAVAADILRAGGCVWTPNVDLAVERACAHRGFTPTRAGRQIESKSRKRPWATHSPSPLRPLEEARGGTLVKFHGSVEAPQTLAFTDRELLRPLRGAVTERLAALAGDRIVVFYGYAGADADLADLIDQVVASAREVHWFEPSFWTQGKIQQAFPRSAHRIEFIPARGGPSDRDPFREVASQFLLLAREHGHESDEEQAGQLVTGGPLPPDPTITLPKLSGASQARLVQRFGANDPDDERGAWRAARHEDLLRVRPRAPIAHLRHAISYSLYHSGVVASVVRWFARHRALLALVQPPVIRNYLITRASALLLAARDWEVLRDFSDWATNFRSLGTLPHPVDSYYRAQAHRYSLRPAQARSAAEAAIAGLEDLSDPERLAGALYEAGEAAIYQAEFTAALDYAFQLRYRRGRYAIPRWQAWGAWLETVALAHMGRLEEAAAQGDDSPMVVMRQRFDFERDPLNRADARTAELLVARVALHQTGDAGLESLAHDTDHGRRRRYRDDLDLLRADFAIASGEHDAARRLLTQVLERTRVPVATHCAQRGLAELDRLGGSLATSADAFVRLADEAHASGAVWYEAQAVVGLQLCNDSRAAEARRRLEDCWPRDGGLNLEQVLDPLVTPARPLWLLTI